MSLFGFGKKKEVEALNIEKINTEITNVCILGSGCAKCNELEKNTAEALNSLGIKANIEHETDFTKIASSLWRNDNTGTCNKQQSCIQRQSFKNQRSSRHY